MMSNTALSSHTSTVSIRNSLPSHKDLKVQCQSFSQDLGYHIVHPTGSYTFRYAEWGQGDDEHKFCRLWQGPNFKHHQVFDVDNGDVWEAREDGIYLSLDHLEDHRDQFAFLYPWDDQSVKLHGLPIQNQLAMSGEAHIPYILLEIPSNFRCGIFIPNIPPRDDGQSGEVHIPYILLEIPSNFRCGIFIPNMPSRDDGYLAIDLGMFGLGSPAPILGIVDDWTNYGSDRVGMYGSGL
ncbi:unnamed protein product [Microthlaspi erraticum]|uniref:S-protein homolog n=1 Tax=Microthlaspi erraticum TaxID=1685480 RepID=A0A6D2JZQ8_9BRAS|nr:unnamed protein product [Microthlaspi erraticum]CAA7045784.1 unnamed protein product [Microthlaspi erraticum]